MKTNRQQDQSINRNCMWQLITMMFCSYTQLKKSKSTEQRVTILFKTNLYPKNSSHFWRTQKMCSLLLLILFLLPELNFSVQKKAFRAFQWLLERKKEKVFCDLAKTSEHFFFLSNFFGLLQIYWAL